MLGHPSQFQDFTYPVPQPDDLGRNGSFVALRILEQDCAAFERFLEEAPDRYGISGELLAAKLCGRWRNGVPLSLSPDTDTPESPIAPEQLNTFDYVPTPANPDAFDNRKGTRCPIGAHIRRMNPRHASVAGSSGLKHRIVRRGLPYGPPFDPSQPDDGLERGLVGLFIGVSLKDQFEFIMQDWVNKGDFAPGISGTRDVDTRHQRRQRQPVRHSTSGRAADCRHRISPVRHDAGSGLWLPAEHHRDKGILLRIRLTR